MRPSVMGVIFESPQKKRVLLVKRRDVPVWVLPGGGVESYEAPEKAILREIEEETGLRAMIVRKVAEYTPVNRLTRLTHFFECRIVSGDPQATEETVAVEWFPVDHLPLMPPPFQSWIEDALLHQTELIQKPVEGVTYATLIKFFFRYPLLVSRFLLTKLGIHFNSR